MWHVQSHGIKQQHPKKLAKEVVNHLGNIPGHPRHETALPCKKQCFLSFFLLFLGGGGEEGTFTTKE